MRLRRAKTQQQRSPWARAAVVHWSTRARGRSAWCSVHQEDDAEATVNIKVVVGANKGLEEACRGVKLWNRGSGWRSGAAVRVKGERDRTEASEGIREEARELALLKGGTTLRARER